MKHAAPWLALILVVGCGGGANNQCRLNDPSSCSSGQVCESVQNQDKPACFTPVQLQGRVFDLSTSSGIGDATVSALDENGAPAASVASSGSDGSYVLRIPSTRVDLNGAPIARKVSLRAASRNYQAFPSGVRISLPIDTSAAVQADSSKPYVLSSGQTDIGLFSLPTDQQGRPTVSGTVQVSPGQTGVLVVAEASGAAITAIADINGSFKLFNVPTGAVHLQAYSRGTNYTAQDLIVQAGTDQSGVQIYKSGAATATLNGNVNLVAGAPGPTSVVLVVESTFNPTLVRGEVPPGLRAPDPGIAPNVTGAWSIPGIPDGRYVVLAAFENDGDVRDPDPNIAGTQIVHVGISGGAVVNGVQPSFKVTSAVRMTFPGAGDAMDVTSSLPVFTWLAYSSTRTYDLVLFDALGNQVWSKTVVAVTSGSNSVSYDGAPLSSGKIYQWRATAKNVAGSPISVTGMIAAIAAAYDPSHSAIPTRSGITPEYIGCRTTRYGPVSIT